MARAAASDFLHSMRFHVTTDFTDDALNVQNFGAIPGVTSPNIPAGFMSVTTPEATTEAVEYREGTFNYPRKFPGNTTVSDCTLQKGVVPGYTNFWAWMRVVIEGSGDYRCNMTIQHFNRSVLRGNKADFAPSLTDVSAARSYVLYEAFAIRHKVAADLDASSSDISVMELDVAYEYFDVVETQDGITPASDPSRTT